MPQPPTTLQVTLSPEAFEFVQQKVASGEYASEGDLLNEGIEFLREIQDERAQWEQEVLIPSIARFDVDPSLAIPAEQVLRNLESRRHARAAAR